MTKSMHLFVHGNVFFGKQRKIQC